MELIHSTIEVDTAILSDEQRGVRRAVQRSRLFLLVETSPLLSLRRRLMHGEPDGELSDPAQDRPWRFDDSMNAMLFANVGKVDRGLGNHLRRGN